MERTKVRALSRVATAVTLAMELKAYVMEAAEMETMNRVRRKMKNLLGSRSKSSMK